MAERTTAEMAERLHYLAGSPYVPSEVEREMNWAAERLVELEAENQSVQAEWAKMRSALAAIHDKLPLCPRCGGKGTVRKGRVSAELHRIDGLGMLPSAEFSDGPCPADCVDGKVSIEKLASTYRAVQEFLAYSEKARSDPDTLRHLLRSVEPNG